MSWGEKHASQDVDKNDQIAREIIGFHDGPRGLFKQKSELLSNNKLLMVLTSGRERIESERFSLLVL
jgi:hypothetical protein